jgi:hypothetical protein
MADIQGGLGRYAGGAPDILGAIQTGAGIAQSRVGQELALEKFARGTKQLELENRREVTRQAQIAEDRATADAERDYDKGIRRMKIGQKLGNVSIIEEGFRASATSLGADIPEDFPVNQEMYDMLLKVNDEKDNDIRSDMEDEFVKRFGEELSSFTRRAEGIGLETGREEREALAAEESALVGKERLITFGTEEDIRQEEERLKSLARVKATTGSAEEKRVRGILDQTTLDEETKNKIIISMQPGVGAATEKALFPTGAGEEKISYMEKEDPVSGAITRIPVRTFTDPKTGKFVFQAAEEFVPETPPVAPTTGTAAAVPAPEEAAPEVTPEPGVQELLKKARTKKPEKKTTEVTPLGGAVEKVTAKKLTELKYVEGAPTLDEYIEYIAGLPQAVNAAGDIIIPETDLIVDYAKILKTQETKNRSKEGKSALGIR